MLTVLYYQLIILIEKNSSSYAAKYIENQNKSQKCSFQNKQAQSRLTKSELSLGYKASFFSMFAYISYDKGYDEAASLNFIFEEPSSPITSIEETYPVIFGLVGTTILKRIINLFDILETSLKNILKFRFNTSMQSYDVRSVKDDIVRDVFSFSRLKLCASRLVKQKYQVTWFFNDFREGSWHDTELIILESPDTIVIAFRGSDSPSDLVTNSQRLETTKKSSIFGSIKGRLHRGIMNAYSSVNAGDIIRVNPNFQSLYDVELLGELLSTSCIDKTETRDSRIKCKVQDVLLAPILKQAVYLALNEGKKVILTGHSLGKILSVYFKLIVNKYTIFYFSGSALAILLAIDVIILDHDTSNKDTTMKAFPSIIDGLSVVAFGQPEFADSTFYVNLFRKYSKARELFVLRYKEFVSLSKAPACKRDAITTITEHASRILGGIITGVYRENENDLPKVQNTEVNNAPSVVNLTKSSEKVRLKDAKFDLQKVKKKTLPRKAQRYGRQQDSRKQKMFAELGIGIRRVSFNFESKNKALSVPFIGLDEFDDVNNHKIGIAESNQSSLHRTVLQGQRWYVHSGYAENEFVAHFMKHYIHGLIMESLSYDEGPYFMTVDIKPDLADYLTLLGVNGVKNASLSYDQQASSNGYQILLN